MSTTYRTISGDTFALIARKVYGVDSESTRITRANPGVSEPMSAGIVLSIPPIPGVPRDVVSYRAKGTTDVALLVDNERFERWDTLRITRSLDTVDLAEFSFPFDNTRPEYRDKFKPLAFGDAAVFIGGTSIFRGTMVNVAPSLSPTGRAMAIACYSLPGVLQDCNPSSQSYPIEFKGLTINEISSQLCAPFGIGTVFTADTGAAFDKVACAPDRPVLDFLAELAKQRGLLVNTTGEGDLRFYTPAISGVPTTVLRQGVPPLVSVEAPGIDAQSYYSEITGLEPVKPGSKGSRYTVRNDRLRKIRPHTYTVSSTKKADIKQAVAAKVGRMFASAITYSISVATWRDGIGEVWAPNTFVKLSAPDAMIYDPYIFLIKTVELEKSVAGENAVLELVIPGAFNGIVPESLPWDG